MALAAFTTARPGRAGAGASGASGIALVLLLPGVALPGAVLPHAARLADHHVVPGAGASTATSASTRPRSSGRTTPMSIAEYWPQIIRSFVYALIATAPALLISYPLAYFIGVKVRRFPLVQNLLMTLVIAPFFISFLLRTLAWKQLLSDESWFTTLAQGALDPAPGRPHHRDAVLGDLRSDLQLHPVHDACRSTRRSNGWTRATSRRAPTCTRARGRRSARSPSRCRCPASSRDAADVHPGGRRLHQRVAGLPRRRGHVDDR